MTKCKCKQNILKSYLEKRGPFRLWCLSLQYEIIVNSFSGAVLCESVCVSVCRVTDGSTETHCGKQTEINYKPQERDDRPADRWSEQHRESRQTAKNTDWVIMHYNASYCINCKPMCIYENLDHRIDFYTLHKLYIIFHNYLTEFLCI